MRRDKEIERRLGELRPLYDEIQQMRERRQELESVEQARDAYESLLAEEEVLLSRLRGRKAEIEQEKSRGLLTASQPRWDQFLPPEPRRTEVPPARPSASPVPVGAALAPSPPEVRPKSSRVRRNVKKMVARWSHAWNLAANVRARINRVADDVERPLGEALALLDWSVFKDRTRSHEREDTYLKRLAEWGEALAEYRDLLAGEIDIQETRFRRWLGIWELWQGRDRSAADQDRWTSFVAETRRAKREEAAALEGEIAQIEQELQSLKAPP